MSDLTTRLRESAHHITMADRNKTADELERLGTIETAAKELTANYSASSFAAFADLVEKGR